MAASKACSGLAGFCAIYRHFSGFRFFLLSNIPSPPTTYAPCYAELVMLSNLVVRQVCDLPEDVRVELIRSAAEEGFKPIQWLIDDWDDETNRFSSPGEALYEARSGNRLVGICGLNRDPFHEDEKIGRLRRLYVLPEFRRKGIGKQLVLRALEGAIGHFESVRLMTLDDRSARFFKAIGFHEVEGEERVSHIITVDSGNDTIR